MNGPRPSAPSVAAVVGASGRNSAAWTQALLNQGWEVRALVREPAVVPRKERLQTARLELDDTTTFAPALEGVKVLALITPPAPQQVERELRLLEAAVQSGVERVVKLSVLGADLPVPISAFARWHAQVEAALRSLRLTHVILRPNAFMQNVLLQRESILQGSYVEPLGAHAVSQIDVREIADVAAAVAGGGSDGRALDLTGPQALTGEDVANALGHAVGRPVKHVSPSSAMFRAALEQQGLPRWRIDALIEVCDAVQESRAPHLSKVSGDAADVTGRPSRGFRAFALEAFGLHQ